jgi:hypothetical protein
LVKRQRLKIQSRQAFALIFLMFFVGCSFFALVAAQPAISLSISKNNGYNLGSDINGQFVVNAQVSSNVVRVEFYLNGTLQYNDTSAPFSWSFNTNNYPLGRAEITAVAYDSSGQQKTAALEQNFVETPVFFSTILPVIVIAVAIIAVGSSVWYRTRHPTSKLVKCPSCGNIYSPSSISLVRIGPSRLRKCPKCGKTFFGGNLKDSPKPEEKSSASDTLTEEERLKRDIEDSKYENKA